jgi:hypothetical protein
MADGQKISTTELLYKSAMRMGLEPSWVIPNGLFAVQIHGSERYINSANSPLNSHVSVSLTRNKHLTRMILQRHGLRNIPFMRRSCKYTKRLLLSLLPVSVHRIFIS